MTDRDQQASIISRWEVCRLELPPEKPNNNNNNNGDDDDDNNKPLGEVSSQVLASCLIE